MKTKLLLSLLLFVVFSCDSTDLVESTNEPIFFETPSNFPKTQFDFKNNPITQKGFELGRKLFYEGRLSSDGTISCGFCHIQQDAFTHHGHSLSHGVNNLLGDRNTPSIQNMAFYKDFMWDGAANHLDLMPIIPITNPVEMNGDLSQIEAMLNADPQYIELFSLAFPGKPINSEYMLKALGQFMAMASSSNSRFDKYRRKEEGGFLSSEELLGYQTFNQKCASCHATDLFTDQSFRNNGLVVNPKIDDVGRFRVSQSEKDRYAFKVPSLRNVELTAPYMHDGRFYSLEAVLNHYDSGVVDSPTLDPILKSGQKLGISLSDTEKQNLIAFLKTLTDRQFITDPRFSEF